jgi:dCMP deaminase
MAGIWSENSLLPEKMVGALIVKDKMIISTVIMVHLRFENICEDENNAIKPYVLHAEANAITKLQDQTIQARIRPPYIIDSICMECANLSFSQVSGARVQQPVS